MHKTFAASFLASSFLMVSAAQAQTLPTMPPHGNMSMPAPSGAITTVLSGPLGSRSASGSATVTGQSVMVMWSGDAPGSVRVWSVREGSCSAEGQNVATSSGSRAITVDAQGNGSSSVTLTAPLNLSEAIHIAVHASQDSAAERLACGSLSTAPSMPGHVAPHQMDAMSPRANGSMAGMDHSQMPGMKANASGMDSSMAGTDHSKMPGMNSSMAGMDHSKMPGMNSSMAGMDHSKMPGMNSNMVGMDHSRRNGTDSSMAGMNHDGMDQSSMHVDATMHMAMSDSVTRVLMSIHQRMMADPVIRERVGSDPTLQRLLKQLGGMDIANAATGGTTTRTSDAPEAGSKRRVAVPAKASALPTAAKTTTKTPVKTPAKAAAKDSVKPAMAPMPGMDHSKMPGMKKPPV